MNGRAHSLVMARFIAAGTGLAGARLLRRRSISMWLAALSIVGGVLVVPALNGAAGALPLVNEPPLTGQIIVFPQRDFISATDWSAFPFVDVEVLRPDPLDLANLIRVGYAKDVVPQPGGIVEINHPGGACWGETSPGDLSSAVTPNISPGDKIRFTGLDANHLPVAVDQTTTSDVAITQFVSQISPNSVELRGTALQADGVTPIPAAQVEVRLISGAKDRFDLNNKRDIRAPGAVGSTFTIDATGHWTATFTGLGAADMARALAAENRVIWLGNTLNEMTIFEVGSLVAPGPSAPCIAPLAAAQASPDRTSIEFSATEIGQSSTAELVRITNVGVGAFSDMTVSGVSVTGTDGDNFSVAPDQCTGVVVAIGGHCDVLVTFAPHSAGLKSAVVQIVSNASNPLIPVTIVGFAVDPGTQVAVGLAQPAVLGFGTRSVASPSTAAVATFKNIGNSNMNISATSLDGPNSGDFAKSADTCSGENVAPNATCSVSLTFTPGAEGNRSATLTMSSNAAPVVVALTGAGLVTTNVFDPPPAGFFVGVFTARDFVSTSGWDPGEAVTVQAIRHGVVIGQGTATAGADGVAEINHPGGGCWVDSTPNLRAGDVVRAIRADGTAYQTTTADVKVTQRATQTAPGSGIVAVKGYARDLATGSPLPEGQIDIRIIASSRDPFTINGRRDIRTSNGSGVFAYDPISASNPDGIKWTATFDLNASPAVAHDVSLAQTQDNRILWLGRDPLALTETTFWEDAPGVVADGPSAPCTAPAQAPSPGVIITPASQTFPQLTTTESAERTYTIRNIGDAPLITSSVTFAGNYPTDFSLGTGGLPGPIPPNGTATFNVKFTPSGFGSRDAVVQVNDNAVGSPHTAVAVGTGVVGAVASALVSPSTLTFPDTQTGVSSTARVVTVLNEGGAPLTLTADPSLAGPNAADFAVDPTVVGACDTTTSLAFGQTCSVTVTFTPSAVNGRSATLTINTNDPSGLSHVALAGSSSTVADGTFDPPRLPHQLNVFPVRDYVSGLGFLPGDVVRFDVYRDGVLIGQSLPASPRDSDPTDNIFDGFVEVNHVGGVCWSGSTPDLVAGDVVRAVRLDASNAVLGQDQLHIQGVDVTMPATQTGPGTVTMTGTAVDTFTGQPLSSGTLEARIVSGGPLFDINGRRTLRTSLEGSLTMIGANWTATYSGLSAADVQAAVTGQSVMLWLGRVPLSLTEPTHSEFGEIPGPDPTCAATAPFATPFAGVVPSFSPATLDAGVAGLGIAATSVTASLVNPGPVALTTSVGAVTGLNAADFAVTSTTCNSVVPANTSCTVTVRFTAGGLGARVASLPITHNGANGISHLLLAGTGVANPTITALTPASARGGSTITITGTSLATTTAVTVGGVTTTFTILNDTSLTLVIPSGVQPGSHVAVVITSSRGNVTNSTLTVTPPVVVPPVVVPPVVVPPVVVPPVVVPPVVVPPVVVPVVAAAAFTAVEPFRAFDTRPGELGIVPVAKTKVGGGYVLDVQLAGVGGRIPVPGVAAVSLNVTVTAGEGSGFVTVFPCEARPVVSSVNFVAGQTVANAVIAPLSSAGHVCFFSSVPADLVVDVNGWYATGSGFNRVAPARVFDTRAGQIGILPVAKSKVGGGNVVDVQLASLAGLIPAGGVAAVSLNVTVDGAESAGFVTVFPCGAMPVASSVNFVAGQTVANAVIATLSSSGHVCFFSSAATDVVVDVNGWFADGAGFNRVAPARVFDTRAGQIGILGVAKSKVGGGNVLDVPLTGLAGLTPAGGVAAVSLNVTVADPDGSGFVTVFPCGTMPVVSSVNFVAGQVVANAVTAPVSSSGHVCFFSSAPTNMIVDINGWFAVTSS